MITPKTRPRTSAVAAHYDDLDRFYLELWGEHAASRPLDLAAGDPRQGRPQLVTKVAAEAGVTRGTKVCDVGCGYGATARMLADEYGAEVLGTLAVPMPDRLRAARGHRAEPSAVSPA